MVTLKYNPPAGFLDEEVRNGYTVSVEMKQVWAVQLDLLQELMRVCSEHGLRIFADGGTLIGAVREHGYIPWDDDIDMCMLREDYDKLVQLAGEFKEPYFLQTVYTDTHYGHRHAQLRRTDTLAVPINYKGKRRHCMGIFVDIFVLDRMPNTPRSLKHHLARVASAKLRLKTVNKIMLHVPESVYRWCRYHTCCLSDIRLFRKYEEVLRSVPLTERSLLGCMLTSRTTIPFLRLVTYADVVNLPFEHIELPCPVGYDEILRAEYGAYMIPVHQPTTHGSMTFDTEQGQNFHK